MRKVKLIAAVLAASMLAGLFSGCGKTTKTTTDKFVVACSKMKLEEIDAEEPDLEPESYEKGFYVSADEGSVDELAEVTDYYLKTFGLTGIVDSKDVESFAAAVKINGYEDLKDAEDISEIDGITLDGAFAMQITLSGDSARDVMGNLKDMFDLYDIKTKNLTSKEFYSSDKEGYFRFHIDISKMSSYLTESDDLMEVAGRMMDEDDFEDLAAGLTGDLAVSIEVNGNSVFVIAGVSLNAKSPSVFTSFAKSFKIAKNPMKLAMNDKIASALADTAFKDFVTSFRKTTTISIDDFEYACENDLEFDSYDFFDLNDIDFIDVENGIYLVSDEAMTDLISKSDSNTITSFLRSLSLDGIIDSSNVESFGFALICKGLEDVRYSTTSEEFAKAEVDGAFAFVMTLKESEYAEDIMALIEDKLYDIDIDIDDLTPEEYYCAGNEGYIRFNIDVNKFLELLFSESDLYDIFRVLFNDDKLMDTVKDLTGNIAISIEVNESNIFVLVGFALNTEPTYLNDFVDAFGAAYNPADIPMNEDVAADLIDYMSDQI